MSLQLCIFELSTSGGSRIALELTLLVNMEWMRFVCCWLRCLKFYNLMDAGKAAQALEMRDDKIQ